MSEAVAFIFVALVIAAVTTMAWRVKHRPVAPPPVSRLRVTKRRRRATRATSGVPDAFASMDGAHEFLKSNRRA
ncbi:hypothetical protein G6M78_08275 [Agrobacterium tumefaciens]|uniref:hypothetical protein n=1 Tax=Agrobacterium tumefaciens TaxID=358 RepID=UPI00157454ED|nr:hypothetical protein [Agrobacterium tumefaciens]NTE55075.1 hypothetical protein [Agrobacterium tumefaciens]NTE73843.1 hypothetical protein [Agrobacterium tumefaciens]